jgi:hypothetical protein
MFVIFIYAQLTMTILPFADVISAGAKGGPKLFSAPPPPLKKKLLVTESDYRLHKRFVVIGKCMTYKLSLLINECAYT